MHATHVGCEDLGLALSLSLTLSPPLCSFSLGVDALRLKHGCHVPLAWLESLKGGKVSLLQCM